MRQAGWQEKYAKKVNRSVKAEELQVDLDGGDLANDVDGQGSTILGDADAEVKSKNTDDLKFKLNERMKKVLERRKKLVEANKGAENKNVNWGEGAVNDNVDSSKEAQDEIIEKLSYAKKAEERVKVFALLMDKFGLDTLIGTVIPVEGDVASSIFAGLYLCYEARNAELKGLDYLKIIALQGADMAVGAVPVIGDVADYAFMANKMCLPFFTKRVKELEKEALNAGVKVEKIKELYEEAEKLPRLLSKPLAIGIEKLNELLNERKNQAA